MIKTERGIKQLVSKITHEVENKIIDSLYVSDLVTILLPKDGMIIYYSLSSEWPYMTDVMVRNIRTEEVFTGSWCNHPRYPFKIVWDLSGSVRSQYRVERVQDTIKKFDNMIEPIDWHRNSCTLESQKAGRTLFVTEYELPEYLSSGNWEPMDYME